MKTNTLFASLAMVAVFPFASEKTCAQNLDSQPPVVVKTVPESGSAEVPPGVFEIRITFSKEMMDRSWSWCDVWEGSTPQGVDGPRYEMDHRTCVSKVTLEPGKTYGYWLNTETYRHFQDPQHRPAVPYLLVFSTKGQSGPAATQQIDTNHAASDTSLLNDDQRAVLAWTDRQFRGFFDTRSFDGWSDEDRATLERKLIDSLKGPPSREYYQAINSLAALRSTQALPLLRTIAFDRADKDCRDRWMATRALGIIGDKESVPEMIHLVYHGNANTRWWAQLSLVRLTGTNFGKDWNAWGNWWNGQNSQPPFKPEIIRWWSGQAEPDKLAESLNERDNEWLASLQPQTGEKYTQQQTKLAQAGNYWAKFNLWEAYSQGTHGVVTNSTEADKWLAELVKVAYLAKFEPINGFNPQTPGEMLDQFSAQCRLFSAKESLGGASFFRTRNQGGKLIGSFLTEWPDQFKAAVEKSSKFKLISMEAVTPEMFRKHAASAQESL